MPTKHCTDCSIKLGFFKKKVQCRQCRNHYCNDCFSKVKENEEELQNKLLKMIGSNCLPCVVLNFEIIKREQLYLLGNKQLAKYLATKNISTAHCKEKYHLVDLIMNYASQHGFISGTEIEDSVMHDYQVEQLRQAELLRQQQEDLRLSSEDRPESPVISNSDNLQTNTDNFSEIQDMPNLESNVYAFHGESSLNFNVEQSFENANNILLVEELPNNDSNTNNPDSENTNENSTHPIENIHTSTDGNAVPLQNQQQSDDTLINLSDGEEESNTAYTTSFVSSPSTSHDSPKSPNRWKSVEDIKSESDIAMLTVVELKQILTANFIDYRGCCEKRELIEKVKMLYSSEKKNEEDITTDNTYEKDICKICMDSVINCVLLDCGHLVACTKCGKRLAECPVCRALVVRVVHIFRV